jgi:alpha-tubulin suppressor-like RCC1 family protein
MDTSAELSGYFRTKLSLFTVGNMGNWATFLRKVTIAGSGLCLIGASVVIAAAPASAQLPSGTTIEHWGAFTGDGTQTDTQLTPVPVNVPGQVAEIASSNSTQYAVLTNGSVYAWGQGNEGELGNGSTTSSFGVAVQVKFPAGVKIAWIPPDVVPFNSALAVDTTGHVWGWGFNQGGEFCLGNSKEHNTPVELPFSGVTAAAGAYDHAFYDANGVVYGCGVNQHGQLGDGNLQSTRTPVRVKDLNGQQVTTLFASFANGGALLSDGQYYDWGYDAAGQLGDGQMNRTSDVPVLVQLPHPVAQVAEGGSLISNGQTFVTLSDGSLYAWGDDQYYELGDGRTANEASPEQIFPPSGVTYQTLATRGSTRYAISTTGDLYAWGNNKLGQVGNGTTATAKSPVVIARNATSVNATANDAVATLSPR